MRPIIGMGVLLVGMGWGVGRANPVWAAESAVLVELFESQGCSSCPPAERVMEELDRLFGKRVVLATFHVDYWDYLGWKDVFSDARYTERQHLYAQRFQQNSMYTPQIVIQGEVGFNGADLRRAVSEVKKRLDSPQPAFTLESHATKTGIRVTVKIPPELRNIGRSITLSVLQQGPPVKILRGENSGATMSGRYAVREVFSKPLAPDGLATLEIPRPDRWAASQAAIAIWVSSEDGRIQAAQALPWPSDKLL